MYSPLPFQALHFGDITSDGYPDLLLIGKVNKSLLFVNNEAVYFSI